VIPRYQLSLILDGLKSSTNTQQVLYYDVADVGLDIRVGDTILCGSTSFHQLGHIPYLCHPVTCLLCRYSYRSFRWVVAVEVCVHTHDQGLSLKQVLVCSLTYVIPCVLHHIKLTSERVELTLLHEHEDWVLVFRDAVCAESRIFLHQLVQCCSITVADLGHQVVHVCGQVVCVTHLTIPTNKAHGLHGFYTWCNLLCQVLYPSKDSLTSRSTSSKHVTYLFSWADRTHVRTNLTYIE